MYYPFLFSLGTQDTPVICSFILSLTHLSDTPLYTHYFHCLINPNSSERPFTTKHSLILANFISTTETNLIHYNTSPHHSIKLPHYPKPFHSLILLQIRLTSEQFTFILEKASNSNFILKTFNKYFFYAVTIYSLIYFIHPNGIYTLTLFLK